MTTISGEEPPKFQSQEMKILIEEEEPFKFYQQRFINNNTSSPSPSTRRPRMIVVLNELPIRVVSYRHLKFEWDLDSIAFQLKRGVHFSSDAEVFYVGSLKTETETEIELSHHQEDVARVLSQLLFEQFRCVPTFLSSDTHNHYYHGFCKHYLWPLFHHFIPPLSKNQTTHFDHCHWNAYKKANKIFANKVSDVLDEDLDYIWIHDYHLMMLPIYLRKRFPEVKLGFFLHNTFPPFAIYQTMPVGEEILRSLLNCDLVGFQTFDYAREFLSCCSRILGLDCECKRGHINVDSFDKNVTIKILHVGIDLDNLEWVLSLPGTVKKVKELKQKFEEKVVILGVDDVDLFKGIGLKFLALEKLLKANEDLRGKVVLVQILNPARSSGQDIQDVKLEIEDISNQINAEYGDEQSGYRPIVCVNGPVSTPEKVAYYAISECCIVNVVRDGMNLIPYEYTVCRQGSVESDKALELAKDEIKKSVIVSECIGCSSTLSGAIRVNPWNIDDVSVKMNSAIKMGDSDKQLRHKKNYKYILYHDIVNWAESFDKDLERACRDNYPRLPPSFKKLCLDDIVPAYREAKSRLILLDYDGMMMPQRERDKAPSMNVLKLLNSLCSDPKNSVFIVSGRDKDCLSNWFSTCHKKLGLSAEHGYFTRYIIQLLRFSEINNSFINVVRS